MGDPITLIGYALAIFSLIAQYRWPKVPRWITDIGLFLGAVLIGMAIEPYVHDSQHPHSYVETSIRFVQNKDTPDYFSAPESKNIYTWRQTTAAAEKEDASTGKAQEIFSSDSFFIIFKKPTQYGWPVIDAFGRSFPLYNFVLTSDRGAVLIVEGKITAPEFEIRFPPPGKTAH